MLLRMSMLLLLLHLMIALHRDGRRRWWRLMWLLLWSKQLGSNDLWWWRNWTGCHTMVTMVLLLPLWTIMLVSIGLMVLVRRR